MKVLQGVTLTDGGGVRGERGREGELRGRGGRGGEGEGIAGRRCFAACQVPAVKLLKLSPSVLLAAGKNLV